MNLTGHRLREEGIIDICLVATLMSIFDHEAPLGPPGRAGNTEQAQAFEPFHPHPVACPPQHCPQILASRASRDLPPPLPPVAQDLGVGCGLTRKDDTLALLHRLWLNGQGHRRRVCKAEDWKSGSFLSLKFPFFLPSTNTQTSPVQWSGNLSFQCTSNFSPEASRGSGRVTLKGNRLVNECNDQL